MGIITLLICMNVYLNSFSQHNCCKQKQLQNRNTIATQLQWYFIQFTIVALFQLNCFFADNVISVLDVKDCLMYISINYSNHNSCWWSWLDNILIASSVWQNGNTRLLFTTVNWDYVGGCSCKILIDLFLLYKTSKWNSDFKVKGKKSQLIRFCQQKN